MFGKARIVVVLGLATLTIAELAAAQATIPIPFQQIQTFSTVGLAAGQTARLTVLNPGVSGPAATAALCVGQLTFLDDQGTVLKTESVSVDPGKSVSFDLDRDKDLAAQTGLRSQVRATISIPSQVSALTPPQPLPLFGCTLVPTLELFNDDTGKTQFVLETTRFVPTFVPTPVLPPGPLTGQ